MFVLNKEKRKKEITSQKEEINREIKTVI